MNVTFASGEPRTAPDCWMPLRSTTGVSVAGETLPSFRSESATTTSMTAAPSAAPKASTIVLFEGRPWAFDVAIRPQLCRRERFRADGVVAGLRGMRACPEICVDRDDARDTRDEQREHLCVRRGLDLSRQGHTPVRDGDRHAAGLGPERSAEDVVEDLARELGVAPR